MTIFDQMLTRYEITTSEQKRNAIHEVMPFVQNPAELVIWSNDYFLQLAERIKYLF